MKPTASTVRPGQRLEFAGIPVKSAYMIKSGQAAGLIRVAYVRPYDDSGNDWRIYPPDYVARF